MSGFRNSLLPYQVTRTSDRVLGQLLIKNDLTEWDSALGECSRRVFENGRNSDGRENGEVRRVTSVNCLRR